jgi:adenylate cyclase
MALSYLGEGLQRRWLRRTFSRYLGEEVLDQLLANPQALRLGGERRALSVLFSDIRDFTSLSERLSPEQLVAFLNAYLTPMTHAVLERKGLLDKYIGDAVMAVFGAPVALADHADQALGCALQMHRELEALAAPLQAQFGIAPRIGVGVNTGEMVVGNMGSAERFDYTVAGDAVNLASRLEGLTKTYGVFCLVGEACRRAASPHFRFREIDLVQVKGKHEPVGIFELLAGPGREVSRWSGLDTWDRALAAYRAGRLAEARVDLEAFLRSNPSDKVAGLYLERLAALPDLAPAGWSPVFEHTHK